MKDERKTKQQLISELNALRRQADRPPSTAAMSVRATAAGDPSGDRFEILFNHAQDALGDVVGEPTVSEYDSFDKIPRDVGDRYLRRIRGTITPDRDGDYTFSV